MKEKYMGLKNRETWYVALWLDNDRYTYYSAWEVVEEASSPREAAKDLRKFVEKANPLANSITLFADLISAGLDRIDWDELAQAVKEQRGLKEEE